MKTLGNFVMRMREKYVRQNQQEASVFHHQIFFLLASYFFVLNHVSNIKKFLNWCEG